MLYNEEVDLQEIQQALWDNKEAKGFNTTDVNLEFCLTFDELAEAFRAYRKQLPDVGEELSDVMLFLLSLAKMLDVDLEAEVAKKMEKNKQRVYRKIKGVNVRMSDG